MRIKLTGTVVVPGGGLVSVDLAAELDPDELFAGLRPGSLRAVKPRRLSAKGKLPDECGWDAATEPPRSRGIKSDLRV